MNGQDPKPGLVDSLPMPSSMVRRLGIPDPTDDVHLPGYWQNKRKALLEDPANYVRKEGILAALHDYVIAPLDQLGMKFVQTAFVDLPAGVLGLEPPDVRTEFRSLVRKIGGDDRPRSEIMREEMARDLAYRGSDKFFGAGLLQGASETAGDIAGMFSGAGLTGKAFKLGNRAFAGVGRVGTKITEKVLRREMPKLLPDMLSRATSYATLQGLMTGWDFENDRPADGWQRAEAVAWGVPSFLMFDMAGLAARTATAALVSRSMQSAEAKALARWITKNNHNPNPSETPDRWMARAIDDWVSIGMPGAPKATVTKLLAPAIEGGIEGFGFSAMDLQWWRDGIDAIYKGDDAALFRFIESIGKNSLALTGLKVGGKLKNIPKWQRSAPTMPESVKFRVRDQVAESIEKGMPEERIVREGFAKIERVAQERAKDREDILFQEAVELGREEKERTEQQKQQKALQQDVERAEGEGMVKRQAEEFEIPGNLVRLGWRPGEGRAEIEGTNYSYEVRGGLAFPSPALRDTLKSQESLPLDKFHKQMERIGLVGALRSKTYLQGETLSVEGIKFIEGDKMYAIRFGEVMSKPIGPDGRWQVTNEFPSRPADPLEYQQADLAQNLRLLRAQRQDLSPSSEAVFDAVIDTISKVSEAKDPAVAEALAAWRNGALIGELVADPVRAENAIMEMAHSLTTKDPMIAMNDLVTVRASEMQQERGELIRDVELGPGEARQAAEAVFAHEQGVPERVALRQKLASVATGRRARTIQLSTEDVAQIGAIKRQVAEAGAPAVEALERLGSKVEASVPSTTTEVFGGLMPSPIARFLEGTIKGARDIVGSLVEADIVPLIERIRTRGEPEKADKLWNVVTRFKENRATTNNAWADWAKKLRSVSGLRTEHSFGERHISELEPRAGWTKFHAMADEKAGEHLKLNREDLPPKDRELLQEWHDNLFLAAGKQMQDAGARLRNVKDQPAFTTNPNRWRMTRRLKPALVEALRSGGPLRETFVDVMSTLEGRSIDLTRKKIDALLDRGAVRFDSAEYAREFDLMPDQIKVGNRWIEIMEAHPYGQSAAMMEGAAMRSAYGEVMGWEVSEAPNPLAGDLPVPSIEFVKSARPEAQKAILDTVRSLHGIGVDAPLEWLRPGTVAYDLNTLWRSWMHAWRGLKMSAAAAVNIPEILGAPATFLGGRTMAKAVAEVGQLAFTGKAVAKIRELAEEGVITREVMDYALTGSGMERVEKAAKVGSQVVTAPFRFVQEYLVEFPMALGIQTRLRAMREADGNWKDHSMLRGMGFSESKAKAMTEGRGDEADYQRYATSAVHWMGGGTTGTRAEKTLASQKNIWRRIFLFSDFFRPRMNQLRSIKNAMGEAWATRDAEAGGKAFRMLLRHVGYGTLSGAAGQAIVKFIQDGGAGVVQMVREMLEDPDEFLWTATVGSLFGGAGGAVLQAVMGHGSDQGIGQGLLTAVAPVSSVMELAEFGQAMSGIADSTNRYSGMSRVEMVGSFAQRLAPAVKMSAEGLFGLSSLAFVDQDPKLDAALDAWWRWKFEHDPLSPARKDKGEQDKEFRSSMKRVAMLVKEKKGLNNPEMREAMIAAVKAKGWDAVSGSLRQRRIFDSDWDILRADQKQSALRFLGDDKVRVLRQYDMILGALADWAGR